MDEGARVHMEAHIRDQTGAFIGHCHEAALRSAEDAIRVGEETAKRRAPFRTGRLQASVKGRIDSVNEAANKLTIWGRVGSNVRYARYQDSGGNPHTQSGNVSFFWESKGRHWRPGMNKIKHPGNPATYFLEDGAIAAERELSDAIRRNY